MTQSSNLGPDICSKQSTIKMDRHPGALKDESSLFSSSLSDIYSQKLRLSARESFRHSGLNGSSEKGRLGSLKHVEEAEAQTIKNLLPDEEELFSGVIEDLGIVAQSNSAGDDSEELDLFSSGGGIELETNDHKLADSGHRHFVKHMTNGKWGLNGTVAAANNAAYYYSPTNQNAGGVCDGTIIRDTCRVDNTFSSAIANDQFKLCQLRNYSPGLHNSNNRYTGNFQPHSLPDIHNHLSNVIPWRSMESRANFVGECTLTGDINRDLHGQGGLLTGSGFSYSSNGFQIPQFSPSESKSYEHQPLRSMPWVNSPSSFMNTSSDHVRSPVQLPGLLSSQHHISNLVRPQPPSNHHVGSAPVVNASSPLLWSQKGESLDDLSLQSSPVRNFVTVPSRSPLHLPIDSSSYHPLTPAGMDNSKSGGLLLTQQMSHLFPRRSPSISTSPSSFGFPNERLRTTTNMNHMSEKKNFELNLDRILRGDDRRTTLMIKNIPNKYTSKMLLATIDEHHKGQYDFIYLPIDFKNKCNVGYAFINMVDPLHVVPFYQTFNGKKWEKFNSEKVACLAYARIQGKNALIAHFQNSSLMNEDKRCRPIIFHTDGPNAGNQEPFPVGGNPRSRGTGQVAK